MAIPAPLIIYVIIEGNGSASVDGVEEPLLDGDTNRKAYFCNGGTTHTITATPNAGGTCKSIIYQCGAETIDLTPNMQQQENGSYTAMFTLPNDDTESYSITVTFIGGVHFPTIYDLTQNIPPRVYAEDTLNCPYSGSVKSITLPAGTYKLECWGAMGGYRSSSSYAGKGGYSVGTLTLVEQTEVFLYAGGSGGNSSTSTSGIKAGGFNGGGSRYGYCGGGGGTDIRVGTDSLYARVIVAGGGGSDGATNKTGMYGGGETGGSATENYGSHGYGGTQTGNSGGASYITTAQSTTATSTNDVKSGFGFGGNGAYASSGYAGAGGGGWYGGAGSYPDGSGDDDRGGGGGSGYIYTASSASNYPSGCLLNSTHYLSDASMIAGNASMPAPSGGTETGHGSSGYIRITVLSIDKAVNGKCKDNGIWKDISGMRVNINGSWKEVVGVKINKNGVWK